MNTKKYRELMDLIKNEEQWKKIIDYFNIKSIWQLNEEQYEFTKNILKKRSELNE